MKLVVVIAIALSLVSCVTPGPQQQTSYYYGGTVSVPFNTVETEAGPIWNNSDAQYKCPRVCGARGWDGNWRTVIPNQMSVCNCGYGGGYGYGWPPPQGIPTSCSARGKGVCRGCSVSCPPGRQASCTEGEEFGTLSPTCFKQARCECR